MAKRGVPEKPKAQAWQILLAGLALVIVIVVIGVRSCGSNPSTGEVSEPVKAGAFPSNDP